MVLSDYKDLLDAGRKRFIEGDYTTAENILQQVILVNGQVPEVYQILGTIYYDKGQFSKAIKHFKRALEIDPNYTDASVGLAIILNDLGKYDEGKRVFEEAQRALDANKKEDKNPFLYDRIAQKHVELADLYFQSKIYGEALEQYQKALSTSQNKLEIRIKIADCYLKQGDQQKAVRELKMLIVDHPELIQAQTKLASIYYDSGRIVDAIDICERVLVRDTNNIEAKKIIGRSRRHEMTSLT